MASAIDGQPGIYFINILSGNAVYTFRIIKI
ncbi:MAG: hypothetical protein AB1458_12455 [Bacteroidota bacterium]